MFCNNAKPKYEESIFLIKVLFLILGIWTVCTKTFSLAANRQASLIEAESMDADFLYIYI